MNETKVPWPIISVGTFIIGLTIGVFSSGEDDSNVKEQQQHTEQEFIERPQSEQSLSFNQHSASEISDEQSKVLIAQLKGQVDKLSKKLKHSEQQLVALQKQNRTLVDDNDYYKGEVAKYSNEQADRNSDELSANQNEVELIQGQSEPYLTQSQLDPILSEDHRQFYKKEYFSMVNKINEFSEQARDENWAFEMEMKISDFVTNHHLSDKFSAQPKCRASQCLVEVREFEANAWNKVSSELSYEPWWPFNSATGTSSSKDGNTINLTIYSNTEIKR